ncbi:hypothetical protein HDV01_005750 [Terramyces sp. JEL0728]|nr:hypothetical protein HDV01_005750 [Terramyces sp. JEL0728]
MFLLFGLAHCEFLTVVNSSIPNNILWPKPQTYTFGFAERSVAAVKFNSLGAHSEYFNRNAIRYNDLMFVTGCSKSGEATNVNVYISQPDTKLFSDESYNLTIPTAGPIILQSETGLGAKRALETLSQLVLPKNPIPSFILRSKSCSSLPDSQFVIHNTPWGITDYPSVSHRGISLDTSRNYISAANIYRIFDAMEAAKLNVFHWHIVDSHSFPLESKIVPLQSYSPYQTYSAEDIKNLTAYALDRGIRIIPEFDMPGHTLSWNGLQDFVVCGNKQPWTEYCAEPPCGQIDISKPQNIEIISNFIKEQSQIFTDSYMHFGHDEINMNCYNSELNGDIETLVKNFTTSILAIAKANNKTPIFWEDVLDHLAVKDAAIQVWKSSDSVSNLVAQGLKVIASPADRWYLDCGRGSMFGDNSWCDPYKTWKTVYNYKPSGVFGGEVALWTEIVHNDVVSILFPRAFAAAEVLWGTSGDWQEASYRLDSLSKHVGYRGINCGTIWPEYCKDGGCAQLKGSHQPPKSNATAFEYTMMAIVLCVLNWL